MCDPNTESSARQQDASSHPEPFPSPPESVAEGARSRECSTSKTANDPGQSASEILGHPTISSPLPVLESTSTQAASTGATSVGSVVDTESQPRSPTSGLPETAPSSADNSSESNWAGSSPEAASTDADANDQTDPSLPTENVDNRSQSSPRQASTEGTGSEVMPSSNNEDNQNQPSPSPYSLPQSLAPSDGFSSQGGDLPGPPHIVGQPEASPPDTPPRPKTPSDRFSTQGGSSPGTPVSVGKREVRNRHHVRVLG